MLFMISYAGYTDFIIADSIADAENKARLLTLNGSFTMQAIN